jgi:hypothetical protein
MSVNDRPVILRDGDNCLLPDRGFARLPNLDVSERGTRLSSAALTGTTHTTGQSLLLVTIISDICSTAGYRIARWQLLTVAKRSTAQKIEATVTARIHLLFLASFTSKKDISHKLSVAGKTIVEANIRRLASGDSPGSSGCMRRSSGGNIPCHSMTTTVATPTRNAIPVTDGLKTIAEVATKHDAENTKRQKPNSYKRPGSTTRSRTEKPGILSAPTAHSTDNVIIAKMPSMTRQDA